MNLSIFQLIGYNFKCYTYIFLSKESTKDDLKKVRTNWVFIFAVWSILLWMDINFIIKSI